MLIFPVFGSALAGMASYLRRDTRTRRLRLLQRVLDLGRKAHGAQNSFEWGSMVQAAAQGHYIRGAARAR
jgi:hypothetical protein